MSEIGESVLTGTARRSRLKGLGVITLLAVPLIAILFQVYLPRFFSQLGYLEFPLLITVYYALTRRSPIAGLFFGAGVGLAQDSLSHQPLGMFGIVKTLVGYFAASISMRFDVDNPIIQFVLSFFFFFFHQFFFWVLARALLGQPIEFNVQQTFLFGLVNAVVAVPLFILLDKMKE
jgi:rod shape-determining protein MreD